MIFGISVLDIYGCARLAYKLYDEFKQAPGACQEFARDLLLFHQVLMKTKATIENEASHLSTFDQSALGACLESCKELLYVQIMGAHRAPTSLDDIESNMNPFFRPIRPPISLHNVRHLLYPLYQRNDTLRIPKLRRAITAQIEKLTVFTVLIIQCVFNDPSFSVLGS